MSSIFVFVSNALSWVTKLIVSLVTWFLNVLEKLLAFFLKVVVWFLKGVLSLVFDFLDFLVSLLPKMPDPPEALQYALQVIGAANQILPIQEFLSLALFWATFYGLIATFRAIGFIRGVR